MALLTAIRAFFQSRACSVEKPENPSFSAEPGAAKTFYKAGEMKFFGSASE